tara:strand:- start:237 stop:488 length:252 start_codon:yes stop_codon:yes gene_type:complete
MKELHDLKTELELIESEIQDYKNDPKGLFVRDHRHMNVVGNTIYITSTLRPHQLKEQFLAEELLGSAELKAKRLRRKIDSSVK